MAFSPLTGKNAAVKIGATAYSFAKWTMPMKTKLPEVSNFNGGGFRNFVSGLTDAKFTVEGPYDDGNMALTSGSSYTWVLYLSASVSLTATGWIESIEISQDVEDAARVKLTIQSEGSFTAAIV